MCIRDSGWHVRGNLFNLVQNELYAFFTRYLSVVVQMGVEEYQLLPGCFGAPLTGGNVSRYCTNHSYNKQAARTKMIRAAANQNPPVYGFDCVCLIKGVLWGLSLIHI